VPLALAADSPGRAGVHLCTVDRRHLPASPARDRGRRWDRAAPTGLS